MGFICIRPTLIVVRVRLARSATFNKLNRPPSRGLCPRPPARALPWTRQGSSPLPPALAFARFISAALCFFYFYLLFHPLQKRRRPDNASLRQFNDYPCQRLKIIHRVIGVVILAYLKVKMRSGGSAGAAHAPYCLPLGDCGAGGYGDSAQMRVAC